MAAQSNRLSGLSLVFTSDGVRPEDATVWLDRKAAPGHESLSLLVFRGEGPFSGLSYPLDKPIVALREFPHLDEIFALFFLLRRQRGEDIPSSWEVMCRYAGDVRQGLWPDRAPKERAVQAVYLAMAQHHLLDDPPRREVFVEEALCFCARIGDKLSGGARLYDDDLVSGEGRLERYVALLAQDCKLYEEDWRRSRRYVAELPGSMSPTGAARTLALVALERPVATQFKLWARTDRNAPGGGGYPLLLVDQGKQNIVLSADPASRAKVGLLAKVLSEREKKARGGQEAPWYDGKDHGGTLVAAPREGTKLSFEEVLDVLEKELRLRPIRASGGRGKTILSAALAAAALAGMVFGLVHYQKSLQHVVAASDDERLTGSEDAPLQAEGKGRGAKGDPLPVAEVINLIEKNDGPRSIVPYALVAGVCGYGSEHELHSPCRDAQAMRDLLIQRYGYKRENIIYLVDKPSPGDKTDGVPTADGLKLAVEKFRSTFGEKDESSFLFYYSGHGGYIKGARQAYGVLQPAEFFGKLSDLPSSHKGWDMQDLISDIRKGVPSKHVMLLLDCCYSGWAVGAKGDDELETHVGSLWKERAEVVITAGSKGQRAWEDEPEERAWAWGGHSALTAFLLEGLNVGTNGRAAADVNEDHVVTDEELARFVKERVPKAVQESKNAKQTPALFRFDGHLPKRGQFLFVPKEDG